MLGCDIGVLFKVAVAGGSYQEGLTIHVQGVPPGVMITEEQIYRDLLLRKPGQGEMTSPRREPDVPIIYSGVNAADTMEGVRNKGFSNGTPFVILIPNLDRHFEHIEQYRSTNRTPRPGHASMCSYQKYGPWDDAIGAGIFSGRYTSTIVAAGCVAKAVLEQHGIRVISYIREAAGVRAGSFSLEEARVKVAAFKEMRATYDHVYQAIFASKRMTSEMRFLEKTAVLAQFEKEIPSLKPPVLDLDLVRRKYGVHPYLNCPDVDAAEAMYREILAVRDRGDSSGGVVEVVATGVPAGMGEPVFRKLDGEIGRMLSIGAVKAVELGDGFRFKDMTGSQSNDQMHAEKGRLVYDSNHAGGIYGGLASGEPIVARLTVKPTPTIAKDQQTVDKVTLENKALAAVTRRDPTIVPRIWPVAEAFMAILLLDAYVQHLGYQALRK